MQSTNHLMFEEQIKQEMKSLKALALQLTRNMDDAKDLVQETMLKALRYKDKFHSGSNLKAWLFTILWTYLFTGNIGEATGFSTVLHLLLSVDYYVHERMWLRVKWGTDKSESF
jgi:RNA polymerase sigma-70 factor (ECF subfamily)